MTTTDESERILLNVLVVEDHHLPRYAITGLLEATGQMKVVAQAESGWQAVSLYRQHRPDVVTMDLRLPELDGISATAAICREYPAARILVLSQYESEDDVARALAAGALGFLRKDVDGATLVQAVRAVAGGQRWLASQLEEQLKECDARSRPTRRELEILQLVFEGLSNQQIADRLGLGLGTVRIHVSHILNKMGVKRRTEAVAVALKRGFLRGD